MAGISGIGGDFLNSITDTSTAKSKAEQVEFEKILERAQKAEGSENDQELMDACEAFESYYLNSLFKEMRASVPKKSLTEASAGRDIYEDMLYDAYAQEIASGKGTGIKDMLYKQLKKH